jgi:hypothetical protein
VDLQAKKGRNGEGDSDVLVGVQWFDTMQLHCWTETNQLAAQIERISIPQYMFLQQQAATTDAVQHHTTRDTVSILAQFISIVH